MDDEGVINFAECVKMDNSVDVPTNCIAFKASKCVICEKYYSVDQDG